MQPANNGTGMEDAEVSGDVIRIRFKGHGELLGMTDGFVLPVANIDSVSTAKVSCRYPRMGSFGTQGGMVFYYMEDGDKVITLSAFPVKDGQTVSTGDDAHSQPASGRPQ